MKILQAATNHKLIASALAIVVISGSTVGIIYNMQTSQTDNREIERIETAEVVEKPEEKVSAPEEVVAPKPDVATQESQSQQTQAASAPAQPPATDNPYAANTPVWYVYDKRKAAGKAVGAWGSAITWAQLARAQGVLVDKTPQQNDVMQFGSMVYFVDSVNESSVTVSTFMGQQQSFTYAKTDHIVQAANFIH